VAPAGLGELAAVPHVGGRSGRAPRRAGPVPADHGLRIRGAYGGAHPGYTLWTIYQPATRYWHFQLIDGGWLLVLSLLLIAATIWIVRRRAA
jgi:hypothetical protein